jgi:NADPH-dependent 7-cyano-7-deazaguanine reductase QueF
MKRSVYEGLQKRVRALKAPAIDVWENKYSDNYRDVGIFNEHVVNKILEDFVRACSPRWAEIVGEFNARGGIRTTVRAEYKSENKPI